MTAESGAQDPAFRQQLVDLLPSLRRFARSLAGSASEGDDLVQAACERALSNAHQWRPGSRLDSCLFRLIQNLFTDGKRAGVVRGAGRESVAPDQPDGGDARVEVESSLLLASVRRACRRRPVDQRKVLLSGCAE